MEFEEILRRQLATFTISSGIGQVIAQAPNLDRVIERLGLGFAELMNLKSVAVFGMDKKRFCLNPLGCTGISLETLQNTHFGLNVMAGEYANAIFQNRHLIVENAPEYDPFSQIGCQNYVVFPLVGRVTTKCSEYKHCGCTECPCYTVPNNPYCWAIEGSALYTGARTEDDRRYSCVKCPLFKCMGLLWLDLSDRDMITGDDISVIHTIAWQTGLVLENFEMNDLLTQKNQELTRTNEALNRAQAIIHRDLEHAQKIQKNLLPSSFSSLLKDYGYEYDAQIEVGGDYFDSFDLDSHHLALLVADVSGHGVSAAMIMSMFKVLLKELTGSLDSPALILQAINDTFVHELHSDHFVTVFFGIWDAQTRTLRYTNAGHPPILIQGQATDEIQELSSCGPFVGMLERLELRDSLLPLPDPFRICLYTDGLIEAENAQHDPFGLNRLKQSLEKSRHLPCQKNVAQVMQDIQTHRRRTQTNDDLTLFIADL